MPKNPLENTFSRKLRNEPVFRFYEKKSSTFACVVWAEESKNGLGFEIRPSYDGFQSRPTVYLMGNPAVVKSVTF